jgi:hypothetical protein
MLAIGANSHELQPNHACNKAREEERAVDMPSIYFTKSHVQSMSLWNAPEYKFQYEPAAEEREQ